ncbi:nuclear transport factor 2 family protein [Frankia sp. AgB1.9]|uniref:nuclear transport factor 2 family protein n=1 Tax=unclassified Frankia TaxID=2632575 RepID=UPI0019344CAF|nr:MULTISPECIES: nuclear transport factor 2 family protein [unclassified Frankia]MBL7494032.1 nuclear transport factor 2 family protein [Frankia sp. AgW1.1]MBL7547511.1 nuclear transport factor 2 family protein [Frankia sp. AgB1.9]MBL7619022.1 nuclear transport factor 2 family protein [Frankia sp. AgB1.8]
MSGGSVSHQIPINVGQGATSEIAQVIAAAIGRVHDAWRSADADERAGRLSEVCAEDVTYANPLAASTGVRALAELITRLAGEYPGYLPFRTSGLDVHHDTACYSWAMRDRRGQTALAGIEFVRFTPVGQLAAIVSFFGQPPNLTYTYRT